MGMKYSFANYCNLRENMGWPGLSPVEQDAVQQVMQWVGHGAPPAQVQDALDYLQSPRGLHWIAKLVGGPSHDSGDSVQRVLQTVLHELGA